MLFTVVLKGYDWESNDNNQEPLFKWIIAPNKEAVQNLLGNLPLASPIEFTDIDGLCFQDGIDCIIANDGFEAVIGTNRTNNRIELIKYWTGEINTFRLEEIRESIQNENISYGEIAELQGLIDYIEPGDVELLQWAKDQTE